MLNKYETTVNGKMSEQKTLEVVEVVVALVCGGNRGTHTGLKAKNYYRKRVVVTNYTTYRALHLFTISFASVQIIISHVAF